MSYVRLTSELGNHPMVVVMDIKSCKVKGLTPVTGMKVAEPNWIAYVWATQAHEFAK